MPSPKPEPHPTFGFDFIRQPIDFLELITAVWNDWRIKMESVSGHEPTIPLCPITQYPLLFHPPPSGRVRDCLTVAGRLAWTKLLASAIDQGRIIDLAQDGNGHLWVIGATFGSREFHT